jgi:hypothetical protein
MPELATMPPWIRSTATWVIENKDALEAFAAAVTILSVLVAVPKFVAWLRRKPTATRTEVAVSQTQTGGQGNMQARDVTGNITGSVIHHHHGISY